MAEGWIKLHRSIQDSWLWKKYPFSEGQAWIDLLMLANYEDEKTAYKGEIITCERGTVNLSITYLANRWRWSRKKTKAFLTLLENDKMVTTKATTHRTTITIENYGFYQDMGTTKDTTKVTARVTTKEQQGYQQAPTTKNIKNIKKDKNIKNNNHYSDDPELNEALITFAEHRKNLKKPLTERGMELIIKKLNNLTFSTNEQIEILNQSIENGWQGVFPLKDKKETINKKSQELDDFYQMAQAWAEKGE